MCGRFTLIAKARKIAERLNIDMDEAMQLAIWERARFNIAPSQPAPAFRRQPKGDRDEVAVLQWGLLPSWAKDRKIAYHTINAMSETVDTKPAFRSAFKRQRCLVPMSGFYEWRQLDEGGKQPYYIVARDNEPFAVAGLWERWEKEGPPIETFTILTTAANELLAPIHGRMPVILAPELYEAWLDPQNQDTARLKSWLTPSPADWLQAYPVNKLVNNPRNDLPKCIEPQIGP